ncbi:MAG: hypothetical protein ACI4WT_11710 [Oligosphaeraceae bacterium]
MIEITKTHQGKTLRIFVEDGSLLLSARDIGALINDRNPNRRLERAGVTSSRYRLADTRGGVQRLRLVTPKECAAVLRGLRPTSAHDALLDWLDSVLLEMSSMRCDFCGGC